VARLIYPSQGDESVRDRLREAATVFEWLRVGPATRVADLLSGYGYYTVRAAGQVGAGGSVWAEDIRPEVLAELRARLDRLGLATVQVVQGSPDDPRIPPGMVDVAIMAYGYHTVPSPFAYFARLYRSLAPGARLGIIEYDGPILSQAAPPALVRCELGRLGFRAREEVVLQGGAYLLVFDPPAELPSPSSVRPCAAGSTPGGPGGP
jgi:ubiquinone/menaquinone biosynthesis C-methylase UbiE